jgi:iron complex outermembrane receptor protein
MSTRFIKGSLLATTVIAGMAIATPAFAQDTGNATTATLPPTAPGNLAPAQAQPQTAAAADATKDDGEAIIVTGSITRNPAAATASPVVSLTSDDLKNRGVTTVASALQTLASNNAGTAPPSWSSFGFATGASAPSLRGLNDAYTLTLFNGMRSAPYPLGDDGYRNFVDINSISESIVDRIDVLQDGASATYGSDAIAGVVNVIIKREVTGVHLNGSLGISQQGDAAERRASATVGYGKLRTQGFNVYANVEYQHNDQLRLGQRGAPFNTADQSSICQGPGDCLFNGIRNGIQADGSYGGFQTTTTTFVRPYTQGRSSLGAYQLADPAAGCRDLTAYTPTNANYAASSALVNANRPITPTTVCQQDLVKQYRLYNSETERKGGTIKATMKLGDNAEAYVMANYYNVRTNNSSTPSGFTGSTAAGGTVVNVSRVFLPTYVCAAGTGSVTAGGDLISSGCTAANGTLNPNNPFAAAGNLARLSVLSNIPRTTVASSKTYRLSGGIDGTFGNGFNFNIGATASKVTLDLTNKGYVQLQKLINAIAQGTYNFVDQNANTAAQIQSVFPDNHNRSESKLTQIQASMNKDLFSLPGGMLNAAVTGQYRYEAIHNPSANPANLVNPNDRYFGVNAVGVDGKRNVWSAGYEITAPILPILKVKALGAYDHYSTGQSRFSPKFEAELKPVKELKLRGTYSKGFRIPSFSESFALPTTGYVTAQINCASATFTAFCAAHTPAYYQGGYSYGLTSSGNANLKPELSTSVTAGVVFTPTRRITLTADYWSTKITNVIIPATANSALLAQYYTNNGVTTQPGLITTPGVADPNNPTGLPLLGTIEGSYKNADSFLAKGIDLSGSIVVPVGNGVQWKSSANASMLIRLQQVNEDGSISRYDASLGACNITSCSGAPKWRANWQNTLDFNHRGNISLTAYYTSGYSDIATDSGGVYGDCQTSGDNGQLATFNDGTPVQCRAKSSFYMDGHAEVKIGDRFTLYGDVLNILNTKPHYEPNAAYGLYQFNPAWEDSQFIGRYFRAGVKLDL